MKPNSTPPASPISFSSHSPYLADEKRVTVVAFERSSGPVAFTQFFCEGVRRMDAFIIHGGKRLCGDLRIHGSKNASLPLMATALMTDEPVVLRDVPDLSDIRNMQHLLAALGCRVGYEASRRTVIRKAAIKASQNALVNAGAVGAGDSVAPSFSGRSQIADQGSDFDAHIETDSDLNAIDDFQPAALTLQVTDDSPSEAHYDIVRTMRASICVLGPMLAKRGYARVSMPGGCNIGARPVDLHLRGLRALGAEIELDGGYIIAKAEKLRGARIFLGGPFGSTVLGTANVMSAATLAEGVTIIESAACEPEIVDVANLLIAMGAKITGAGSPRIVIEGVESLHGTEYTVMPDRIEAGTYMMAAAITNGDVTLQNCPFDCLTAAVDRMLEIGVQFDIVNDGELSESYERQRATVRVASTRHLQPVQVITQPHPGFPTDLQAQIMALLCFADGNSVITEKIFPDRFMHTAELLRMGANISRNGPSAMVSGVRELIGAPVMASDLRASAGLILAGLAARGTTTVNRVYHLDRGYERMELSLKQLGADIERVEGESV